MAVYTEVSDEALADFLAQYTIGTVVSCKGIAEGVENSNYLLQTGQGSFILTLYEKRVARKDLPFFLGLMEHLAREGVPCPVPIRGRDGEALRDLAGRPAAIISFLKGLWPRRILPEHCRALGEAMAGMHRAGKSFALSRPNTLSLAGWKKLASDCRERAGEVKKGLSDTITAEIAFLEKNWPANLPRGIIHADLFPDNVFFLGDGLSGLIDFYFACNDFLAYDLAVALNAWCFEPDNSFNVTKARQLLGSYNKARALEAEEKALLPVLCRGAALRFLLTRLYDWLHHPEGAFVKPKNPAEYIKKLSFHQKVRDAGDYGLARDTA